ncbi:MAG: dihydrodipicolinate synthase family protein [Chloroflexota bacterium]
MSASGTVLAGVVTALITPLRVDGRLNRAGLSALVQRVLAAGVDGISVLGSTGEGALLPAEVQREVLEHTLAAVAGACPVVPGILASTPVDMLRRARLYFDMGVDAVMAVPPYYYLLDQQSVVDFYGYIGAELARPVVVYHFPALTKVQLDADTVVKLADLPHVVGLKDSGGDETFHRQIVTATRGKDFQVFAGSGTLASANFASGGAGMIAASANLIPAALVSLWRALSTGDEAGAARWHSHVSAVEQVCRRFPYPTNWKTAVECAGLLPAQSAFPLHHLSPDQVDDLRVALRQVGAVPAGPTSQREVDAALMD